MPKISRVFQKIFALTNDGTQRFGNGQFGSGKLGTKQITDDVEELQALAAYDNGWKDAVMTNSAGQPTLPPLEEMQALNYIETYQIAYLFQEGIPEYNADTTYFINSIVKLSGTYELYGSNVDDNIGNAPGVDPEWDFLCDLSDVASKALATTSAPGIVELATSAEVQGGTDPDRAITPSAMKTALGFSKYFQSNNISFTLASDADIAHGLGTTPTWWFAYIQCTTAEDNWSVGDQIPITSLENTLNSGIIVAANSSNMRYTVGTGTISYLNRTAHTNSAVTPANWALVIKAWA